MELNKWYIAGLFLLTIFWCGGIVSADNGGYIITPHTGEYPEGAVVDDGEAEHTITFWSLPLWIQFTVISGLLLPFLNIFKIIPFLLGRIAPKKDNNQSENIISFIVENPGCTESDISSKLGIKRGTLRYYLDKMKSNNLIFTIRKGKYTGLFHKSCHGCTQQNVARLHLINNTRKTIISTIINNPGVTGQELSFKLGLDKSTIHWHVSELQSDNIIFYEKEGKFNKYYPQSHIFNLEKNVK
ncbi:winged helix-turn-helix transcriptional regulator [Methanolobus sp. WCC1]|uniref:winged helix-turn-helix transcriptional regulator n=1 Tax=unclassified Methanolobus TaxID=2629569 RepID=UPI00324A32FC